jgi:NADH-quinone oxidoreductase subunit L
MEATIAWLILFLPLFAAVIITLFLQRHRGWSAGLSIGAVLLSFVGTVLLFFLLPESRSGPPIFVTWLAAGALKLEIGLRLDYLSLLMLLVVTGVGSAIHIYSYGYMHEDPGLPRYFACMSLFTFSMLGIVLANNLFHMFIFWELVGVSSFLLIGFWYQKDSAAEACKKAFLTNRVGDFGFILGILLIWGMLDTGHLNSLNFEVLELRLSTSKAALGDMAGIAGLLIFCGAMGKSAQFPLHVWLPDAMEGPTPVSALIHAATMVAAGVYMLCRLFFLFDPFALNVIACVGGFTSLMAAVIAVQQNDIKRILAYSTLSQLGYMVMAVGVGGPAPAMYHLTTHAFFKALLFLGAGSLIHALHHEQDIWKMGGLRDKMPVTFWTFLVGTLALCGVPPMSGFYSKDEILLAALNRNPILFGLGIVVATLTTFYMFRLVLVAFLGPAKSQAPDHAHESPRVMTVPLMVLAAASALGGFMGIDHFVGRQFESVAEGHSTALLDRVFLPFNEAPMPAFFGLFAVAIGFSVAWGCYARAVKDPLPETLGVLSRLMRNKFYFDEIYDEIIAKTQDAVATATDWFDRWIIAGLMVKGVHGTTELFGRALRLVQTGNLQTYAFLFIGGMAFVLGFYLLVLKH